MIRVLNIQRCVTLVALTLLLGSCFECVGATKAPGGLGGETPDNDPDNDAGPLKTTPRRLGAIAPILTDGTAYSFFFNDDGGISNDTDVNLIPAGSVSPFTFTTNVPTILQVADTYSPDLRFSVMNFGVRLGSSTNNNPGSSCGTNVTDCFASQDHASFALLIPAGSFSLSFPSPTPSGEKTGILRLLLPTTFCGPVGSVTPVRRSLQQAPRDGNLRRADHRALNGWFPCGKNSFCVKERATCAVDDNGMGTCTCIDGYDGRECRPEDECETESPCPGGSRCSDMYLPEKFKCECKEGFTPFLPNELPDEPLATLEYRPVACIDNDECANTTHPPCHPMASCTNTIGSFECKCNDGLVGNGITACTEEPQVPTATEAPPGCSIGTDCQGSNMQCVNATCICRPGYVQVGPNCQNEVHCDEGGFNNDCHRRATCTEEVGFPGFSCKCIEGWEDAFEGANGKSCKDIPPVTEAPPDPPVVETTTLPAGVGPHPNRPTVFGPPCVVTGAPCGTGVAGVCCAGVCGTPVVTPVTTPGP